MEKEPESQSFQAINSDSSEVEQSIVESSESVVHTEQKLDLPAFGALTPQELLQELQKICDANSVIAHKNEIEEIRVIFYKKIKAEAEQAKSDFVSNGGEEKDFVFVNTIEENFKAVYATIKKIRQDLSQQLEQQKQKNLEIRLGLIEELKVLVNKEESLHKTYDDFKSIQKRWRETGAVPVTETKKLWDSYQLQIGIFYDYVKINKELRDLDLKKNLEAKIILCEKAEALLLEKLVVNAFSKLQDLHNSWREIGPVTPEKNDEIWNRFKTASTIINKAHQDYFLGLKDKEQHNLEAKTALCEKMDVIVSKEFTTLKEWNAASNEVAEIQKEWKTIGYAPKNFNTSIYERFSAVLKTFFESKKQFILSIKSDEDTHKLQKVELCVLAEQIVQRTDWKSATEDLLELQAKWKKIGPVSYKDSLKLWERFRLACDAFFAAKKEFYNHKDVEQAHNYEMKKQLLDKINALPVGGSSQESLEELQKIQKEWHEIGLVPAKKKDKIIQLFKTAVQAKLDALQITKQDKQKAQYKVGVDTIIQKGSDAIVQEAIRIKNKIKTIESEIVLLENNIGFFAKSKGANALVEEVQQKIDAKKQDVQDLKKELQMFHQANKEQKS